MENCQLDTIARQQNKLLRTPRGTEAVFELSALLPYYRLTIVRKVYSTYVK